jgi:hypothetical protein
MRSRVPSYRFAVGASAFLAAAVAMVWSAKPAHAQAACCNTVTSQTVVAPDPPFAGPVYFNLQSSCTGKVCGGSTTLSPSTTTNAKCAALVAAINSDCAAAGFQVLAAGNLCANNATFTVTDTGCNCQTAGNGKGLTLLLSNSLGTGSFMSTGFLPDYEDDIITTCGGATAPSGGSLGSLSGTATGTPIVGGTQADVVFEVLTEKGSQVIEQVNTSMGETAAQVVTQGVSLLNQALAGVGSPAKCAADPKNPTSARCALAGSGTTEQDLQLSIQLNDTGFVRVEGSGPAGDIQKVENSIDSNGGISNLQSFNVVSGVNAPAGPPWTFAALAALLGAGGLLAMKRRERLS